MECSLDIIQDDISVSQQAVVLVDETLEAEIVTVEPIVQINSEEFVLSSGGMYGGSALVGAIPDWILNAIQQELTTGSGNLTTVVSDIQLLLNSLQLGVNQIVDSLNTLASSSSSITTSLQSQVDINHAEFLNVSATKVDATQAQSISVDALQSAFGNDINAYIANISSTYVNANSAIAQEIGLIQSTLGGVSSSVTEIANATTEYVLNPLWVDDGVQTDPDASGNPRYVLQASAKKQFTVDANGVITSLILESGATSAITMQADQFKLIASGQSVAVRNPFTVNAATGEISFVGVVDFTSTNATGTTTIDGGKITTGTVDANRINAATIAASNILVDQTVRSSDFTTIGGVGFRLKSNAAGIPADPTIYGAYIKGGVIDGSLITGQFIDINSTYILNPAYPTVSGRFFLSYSTSTQGALLSLLGPLSGSGYAANRVVSSTQKVTCMAYVNINNITGGDWFSGSIYIYRKKNGGAATLIASNSGGYYAIGGGGTFIMASVEDSVWTGDISTLEYYYAVGVSNASVASSHLNIVTQNTI